MKSNRIRDIILWLCVAVFLAAMASLAMAAPVTVTYALPTTNTDGSDIPASGAGSISSLRIEYGSCVNGAFGTKDGETTITKQGSTPLPLTRTIERPPGNHAFRVFATNTYGAESGPSNVACRQVSPPTPNPPQIVTLSAEVYDVVPDWSRMELVANRRVGSVALGVPCIGEHRLRNGYYPLPRTTKVRLGRHEPKSPTLVAKCGPKV